MDLQLGFRIGPWTVQPTTGGISSGSNVARLEPKVMEVLLVLAGDAPDVVLRDTLLGRVWGARAAISDEPLTRCIAQLRQALGDSARNPEYIQTIPKRGYRLLMAVEPLEQAAAAAAPPTRLSPPTGEATLLRRRGVIAAGGAVAVLGFGIWALRQSREPVAEPSATSGGSSPASISPANRATAQPLYAEALRLMGERSYPKILDAITLFEAATRRDTTFAEAYIDQAVASILLPYYASTLGDAERQRAQGALMDAMRLLSLGQTYAQQVYEPAAARL
jgi:DNA-binding winged helix-turn-helix (wHTH) protein